MILVIDNYDSFTYNLVQYIQELGQKVRVVRNGAVTLAGLNNRTFSKIVISPGPGKPSEAGISEEVIKMFYTRIPILGVCLGHQCIGEVFGGTVRKSKQLMHGKTSLVHHSGEHIYRGLSNPFVATRYHSLIVQREDVPACLRIDAHTDDGEIMGLSHREYPVYGVQFHPESILTVEGKKLLQNFLEMRHE